MTTTDLAPIEARFDPRRAILLPLLSLTMAILMTSQLLTEKGGFRPFIIFNALAAGFSLIFFVPAGCLIALGNGFDVSVSDGKLVIRSWWGKKNESQLSLDSVRWWMDRRGRIVIRYCSYLMFIKSMGIWPYRVLIAPKPVLRAAWVRTLSIHSASARPLPDFAREIVVV
jgi:hypothetical protein